MQDAVGRERWARDYVFDILRDLGIHHIFGVPGTNEIPIIDGTSYPENQVDYVECLHENIAMGAAMGTARITGKPGVVLLHMTPGIGHAIGNLFNASRSRLPLVVLCSQQQNELVTQQPLLASNVVELARQYAKWAHEVRTETELPLVLQRAFKEAMAPPNGPVFVAIPWEFTIRRIDAAAAIPGITRISSHFTGDAAAIREAAELLARAENPLIVAGDPVGCADAWKELQELAELIGAPVLTQTFSSLANFPNDDYHWQGELPGNQQGMQQVFQGHDLAFLCGFTNQAQVALFQYSQGPLIPSQVRQIHLSNDVWDIGKNDFAETAVFGDIKATLPLFNDIVRQTPPSGAAGRNLRLRQLAAQRRAAWDAYLADAMRQPDIWAAVIAQALREEILAQGLQKRFVYAHEALSDWTSFQYLLPLGGEAAAPVSYYCVGGGSLGWSMPATLGLKAAREGTQGIEPRLVVAATGDGACLFYPQTWWTASNAGLGILYIITNNSEYHTLQMGLDLLVQSFGDAPGYGWRPRTMNPEYLHIDRPKPDFVTMAKAMGGIEGEQVVTPGAVRDAVRRGINHVTTQGKPYLLDMRTVPLTQAPPTPQPAVPPRLDFFHTAPANTAPIIF